MQKVLITGASGFVGTNLVDELIGSGYSVLGIDFRPPRKASHRCHFQLIDVLDFPSIRDVVAEFSPEFVVHLAARTDLNGTSLSDYAVNIRGTENVMNSVKRIGSVRRVVYASTRLVNQIGETVVDSTKYSASTLYGRSKVEAEQLIRAAQSPNCTWCIVRPTSLWGPWFGIPYRTFFDAVMRGRYLHPAGVRVVKSFGYVGNSVFQIRKLLEAGDSVVNGRVFYLTDYDPIALPQFAVRIAAAADAPPVRQIPFWLLAGGAKVGDALKHAGWREPPLTTFRLNNLVTNMLYDAENLRRITGDLPYSVEQGIVETIRWIRNDALSGSE